MEGIQTIQALKAVQSSLPAQTTIPSDELVMLYATDGTPIAKISRDDLVKAVASVMASNSQNTFSKLLGVQANGTPMGIGASDLASVLGVWKRRGNITKQGYDSDFNKCIDDGYYYFSSLSEKSHAPSHANNNAGILLSFYVGDYSDIGQVAITLEGACEISVRLNINDSWHKMQ